MSGGVLIFALGKQLFALPLEKIPGVLQPVQVTPVPFSPPYVDGLIGSHVGILPQINLESFLFKNKPSANLPTEGYELIRLTSATGEVALRVDRVTGLEKTDIIGDLDTTKKPKFSKKLIEGSFKRQGRRIWVLSAERLVIDGFDLAAMETGTSELGSAREERQDDALDLLDPVLVVETGGEHFAFPMDCANEVFPIADLRSVPKSPEVLIGVLPIRESLIGVLSLADILGCETLPKAAELTIVINHAGTRLALQVERIHGLKRFSEKQQHKVFEDYRGVDGCDLGKNGEMIGVIDLPNLITDDLLHELAPFLPHSGNGDKAEAEVVAMRKFILFEVGEESYAIDAGEIDRVAEWSQPETVPEKDGSMIDGITHIHGAIVPVSDLRQHLGADTSNDPRAFIVAQANGGAWALSVDSIKRLINVPEKEVRPLEGDGTQGVTDVIRLEDSLIWVLSPTPLSGQAHVALEARNV